MTTFHDWLVQRGEDTQKYDANKDAGLSDERAISAADGEGDQLFRDYGEYNEQVNRQDSQGRLAYGTGGFVNRNTPIEINGTQYGQAADAWPEFQQAMGKYNVPVTQSDLIYDPQYGNLAPMDKLGRVWDAQGAETKKANESGFGGNSALLVAMVAGAFAGAIGAAGGFSAGGIPAEAAGGSIGGGLTAMDGPGAFESLEGGLNYTSPEIAGGTSSTAGGVAGAEGGFNGTLSELNTYLTPETAPGQSLMTQNLAPTFPGAQTPISGLTTGLSGLDAAMTGGAVGSGALAGLGAGAANVATSPGIISQILDTASKVPGKIVDYVQDHPVGTALTAATLLSGHNTPTVPTPTPTPASGTSTPLASTAGLSLGVRPSGNVLRYLNGNPVYGPNGLISAART